MLRGSIGVALPGDSYRCPQFMVFMENNTIIRTTLNALLSMEMLIWLNACFLMTLLN